MPLSKERARDSREPKGEPRGKPKDRDSKGNAGIAAFSDTQPTIVGGIPKEEQKEEPKEIPKDTTPKETPKEAPRAGLKQDASTADAQDTGQTTAQINWPGHKVRYYTLARRKRQEKHALLETTRKRRTRG